jgi:hypothetical protein
MTDIQMITVALVIYLINSVCVECAKWGSEKQTWPVQWGSKYQTPEIRIHPKSEQARVQISVFGFWMVGSDGTNHSKSEPIRVQIQTLLFGFWAMAWILDISELDYFQPFKIRMCLDFRSPLYSNGSKLSDHQKVSCPKHHFLALQMPILALQMPILAM